MRLALIADGRAEHVRRWVRYFVNIGDELMVLSTHPCSPIPGVRMEVLPGVFRHHGLLVKRSEPHRGVRPTTVAVATLGLKPGAQFVWQQAKTLDVLWQVPVVRRILAAFRPELVHALRLQTEGYIASLAGWTPWILSTWGQDFVWFTHAYPIHRYLARWTLKRTDGLLADCRRDLDLAREAGFPAGRPTLLCPGNGGVDFDIYRLGVEAVKREPLVVFPRGLAPYVRIDTLLRAVAMLDRSTAPDLRLIILVQPALVPVAIRMVEAARIRAHHVRVLPMMDQEAWASLMQHAAVMVSPAVSDGTPNTMLEAMACGALPVMGNIASIREWIRDGVNGLLFDPENPLQLAACLGEALENVTLRQSAQRINRDLVTERADYTRVMPAVRAMYLKIIAEAAPPQPARVAGKD